MSTIDGETAAPAAVSTSLHFRQLPLLVTTYVVMSGIWALLILLVRLPFGSPEPSAILKAFLLAAGAMLGWLHAATYSLQHQRTYALALLAMGAIFCLPALAWLGEPYADIAIGIGLAVPLLLGLRTLSARLRHCSRGQIFGAIASGCILAIGYFFIINVKSYASVFSPEQTILGSQHRDTLFHASMAAVIANYAAVSTGLDGLVPTKYHFLSHALIGLTGLWMKVSAIHAYYLVSQIVGIPVLFFSLGVAAGWIRRPSRTLGNGLLLVWAPLALLSILEIWDWASYLVSESYWLALIILLLALPLLIEEVSSRPAGATWRYVALAASLIAIVLAKNSVGAIFGVGLGYALLRARGWTVRNVVILGLPLAILGGLALILTMQPGYTTETPLEPFHFLKIYPHVAWTNTIAIVSMLAIAARLWPRSSHSEQRSIEVLAVLAAAALVSGLLVRTGAGSAYYFLNVGTWIAIAFGAGAWLIPLLETRLQPGWAPLAAAGIALLAASLQPAKRDSPTMLAASFTSLENLARAQSGSSQPSGRISVLDLFWPDRPRRKALMEAIGRSPGGRIMAEIAPLIRPERHDQIVYVPPGNAAFWTLNKLCSAQPFFVPAMLGLPLLNGLPPNPCPEAGYSFDAYPPESRSVEMGDAELCGRAKERGYAEIIVLNESGARRIECHST